MSKCKKLLIFDCEFQHFSFYRKSTSNFGESSENILKPNQQENQIFDLSACRHSSSSDQILSPSRNSSNFASKRQRNLSVDGLNDRVMNEPCDDEENQTPKRNSIVSAIVAK